METKIIYRGSYHNVNSSLPPKDSKELDSFLLFNKAPRCFLKTGGKWFKITKDGKLLAVCRTLKHLSLSEWLGIAKDTQFIPNII